LTLTVVPVAVVAILAGIFLMWSLLSEDVSGGLSGTDVAGIGVAVVVTVVSLATIAAVFSMGRSMTRDIERVTTAARKVGQKDVVDLLDALRVPDSDLDVIAPLRLDYGRTDEVGDLARAIDGLHASLIEVAGRQVEALRGGVSSIFVTLARRNSSLVDRQLALLDELESREEDAKTLGGYYQLDHLATRMRRNAESLLVLAGSESPRVWAKATDIANVVRAAISEVDEYRRIEVLALEPAKLSGGAVSDISHMLAELLENAIQFSPPSESVRLTGLYDTSGYQITVSDRGVGISDARLTELNRMLAKPPSLGLSVEPRLGMFVVAKLAHRHGVNVELARGVPGVTARVTVPRDHLEVVAEAGARPLEIPTDEPRTARGPDLSELNDAASVQYVLRRSQRDDDPVTVSAAAGPDDIIDLTDASMNEPEPASQASGGLPVRPPGKSFSDDDESPSTAPGEGAISLKSALAAFERGRRAAEDVTEEDGT